MAKALNRNAIAMVHFTMAFEKESTMSLVYKAYDADWPNGLANKVAEALFKKYRHADTIDRVELRQMLIKVAMKGHEDPSTLFEQLSGIQNRYNKPGTDIPKDDLVTVVLDSDHLW
jgi:hypothetical protein